MKSFRTAINEADDCMAAGNKEAAKAALQDVLERFPHEKSVYGDTINIYLVGKMFDEAREVFSLYKNRFGKDLRYTDFTLDDITREQNEYESGAKNYDDQT